MAIEDVHHFNGEELEDFGLQIKDAVLTALLRRDQLTHEQHKRYSKSLTVVIKKRSKLSQYFLRNKRQEEQLRIFVAEIPELADES